MTGGPDAQRCASCGTTLHGPYCALCGERRLRPDEYAARRFVKGWLADLTSLDATLFRTLRALAFAPGLLTREYLAGRRVGWLRPAQLFLIANLVYFVVQPFTGYSGYNTPLDSQMRRQVYSSAAGIDAQVRAEVARRGTTLEHYAELFDSRSEVYAKTLVFVMIPLFALVIALLELGRGRRFVEHIVFATHHHAFGLFWVSSIFMVVYGLALQGGLALLRDAGVEPARMRAAAGGMVWALFVELPNWFVELPWLAIALRRVYADRRAAALAKALALIVATLVITFAYRYLLFWVTFASV